MGYSKTKLLSPPLETPSRQSTRKMVMDKRPKPTNVIHHQLLLGPTLLRQAKKRGQQEREREEVEEQLNKNMKNVMTKSTRIGRAMAMGGLKQRGEISCLQLVKTDTSSKPPHVSTPSSSPRAPKRKMSAVTPDSVPSSLRPNERFKKLLKGSAKPKSKSKKKPVAIETQPRDGQESTGIETDTRATKTKPQQMESQQASASRKMSPPQSPAAIQGHARKTSEDVQFVGKRSLAKHPPPPRSIGPAVSSSSIQKQHIPFPRFDFAGNAESLLLVNQLQLMEMASNQRAVASMQRRQYALQTLATANDVETIYATLTIINDLSSTGVHWHAMAAQIVSDAKAMGEMILGRMLLEKYQSPRIFGGFGYCEMAAHVLVTQLVHFLSQKLSESMSVTPEQLVGQGFTGYEAMEIVPTLHVLVAGIRQRFIVLSEKLLTVGFDGPAAATSQQVAVYQSANPFLSLSLL